MRYGIAVSRARSSMATKVAFSIGFAAGLLLAIPIGLSLLERTNLDIEPAVQASAPVQVQSVLQQVGQKLRSGDVAAARVLLTVPDGANVAPYLFALAETYDPNILAALDIRGVVSDADQARALYSKALDLGLSRAATRLALLQ